MALPVIAIQAGVMVGLWALNKWAFRNDDPLPRPRPQGMDFAQAGTGSPIPLVYGTIRVDNAVLIEILNRKFITNSDGAIRYGASMLLVIGSPPERDLPAIGGNTPGITGELTPILRRFWYGDVRGFLSRKISHGQEASATETGDPAPGGTFISSFTFFDGRKDQKMIGGSPGGPGDGARYERALQRSMSPADFVIEKPKVPGFRHQMLVFVMAEPGDTIALTNNILFTTTGDSPNVKNISVEVTARTRDPIGTARLEANPAWVIYDLLVSKLNRLGILAADVDMTSFAAVALTLQTELNGCSLVIYQQEEAPKVIGALLDQIDGALYVDQSDGKIHLRLARNDWNPLTARAINADNTIGFPHVSTTNLEDVATEVRVTWTNRFKDYQSDIAIDKRLANSVGQDGRSTTIDVRMPAVCREDIANKLAARELGVYGRPRLTVKCSVSREFFDLKILDVVKVTYQKRNIIGVFMRVLDVDLGQLAKGEIGLTLVEDVFGYDMTGVWPPRPTVTPDVYPLTRRYIDEVPFFLIQRAFGGSIANNDSHIMGAAVPEDTPQGTRVDDYGVNISLTPVGNAKGAVPITWGAIKAIDVPVSVFPVSGLVDTAYTRTTEPYDTTTGLIIKTVNGDIQSRIDELVAFPASESDIRVGRNLILVVPGGYGRKTGGEFMSFETITDLGGGRYRLSNVWRADMDTAPLDWAVDDRVYLIGDEQLGTRRWQDGSPIWSQSMAGFLFIAGSDNDPIDVTTIASRLKKPLRIADLRASGYELAGTKGTPAVNDVAPKLGGFKELTDLDGGIDLAGNANKVAQLRLIKGSDTSETADTGTTYDVQVEKDGEADAAVSTGIAAPFSTSGTLLGKAGHGTLRVRVDSKDSAGVKSWQSPRIKTTAHRYRGLLANASFEYNALAPGWTIVSGTPTVQSGTNSLQQSSTGRWSKPSTGGSQIKQIADVTGYRPVGLTALVTWYTRCEDAGADTSQVRIRALDSASVEISNTLSSTVIGPSDHWRRSTVTHALPINTAKIEVDVIQGRVAAENSGASVSRVLLQVGQLGSQLLLNPSFDSSFTSWTNVTNSFVAVTNIFYASDDGTTKQAARGGSFATSEIRQDVTVPVGYEYGTAVVELARAHDSANGSTGDTGQVILQALDGGGSVLATTTGAAEDLSATPNVWVRRRYAVDLPDGTVTVRVRLLATKTGLNSGALFDDLSLRVHKHLDPSTTVDFNFGSPKRTYAPTDWPQWYVAHPTFPIPAAVWDGTSVTPSTRRSTVITDATHAWSDAGAHTAGKFVAYMNVDGQEVVSTDAFVFARAAAGSAIDIKNDDGDTGYGDNTISEPFSVAVLLRVDELAFASACGIVGRRLASGVGWGLALNASGNVVATIQGASGTVTATSTDSISDRSPRWVVMTHDGTNVKVFTRAGSASAGTGAVGAMGTAGATLRIGRDRDTSETLPGMIARVYLWDAALSATQAQAIVDEIGTDPSALITTWTADKATWIPGPDDTDGATLIRCATTDVPIAYNATLDANGDGYGLALTRTNTNQVQSFDVASTSKWGPEAGTFTLVRGVKDPTGLVRGMRVGQSTANAGFRVMDMPTPLVGYLWSTVVYLRNQSGATSVDIQMLDGNGVSKGTVTVALTSLWQRFVVQHNWDGATPTAHLRFVVSSGGTGTYEIGHVLWSGFAVGVNQQCAHPVAIQDAAVTIADTGAVRAVALGRQHVNEGEIYVEGTTMPYPVLGSGDLFGLALTDAIYLFAAVEDDGTNINRRMFVIDPASGSTFRAELYNATGVGQVPVGIVAGDSTTSWAGRARWNTLNVSDSIDKQRGAAVTIAGVNAYNYVANAFTVNATTHDKIRIGGDGATYITPMAVVRRVIVRTREPKMTGA